MKTTNIIPFIEFVKSQPNSREVNHTGWHSCAVADFCEATGLQMILEDNMPTCVDGMVDYRLCEEHIAAIESELDADEEMDEDDELNNTFLGLLNSAKQCRKGLKSIGIDINTYGGLKEVLSKSTYCPKETYAECDY